VRLTRLTYEGGRWRPDATQDSLAQFGIDAFVLHLNTKDGEPPRVCTGATRQKLVGADVLCPQVSHKRFSSTALLILIGVLNPSPQTLKSNLDRDCFISSPELVHRARREARLLHPAPTDQGIFR
jgi:hypothetical protein